MSCWLTNIYLKDGNAARALWDVLNQEDWEMGEIDIDERDNTGNVVLYAYGYWEKMRDRLVQYVKDNPSVYMNATADDGNWYIGFYAPGDGTAYIRELAFPGFDNEDDEDDWKYSEPWDPEGNEEDRQQLL